MKTLLLTFAALMAQVGFASTAFDYDTKAVALLDISTRCPESEDTLADLLALSDHIGKASYGSPRPADPASKVRNEHFTIVGFKRGNAEMGSTPSAELRITRTIDSTGTPQDAQAKIEIKCELKKL
ncbi:hypothetical protein K2X33_16140 [bacterium]|nr:hypothetical protein [bacterium]